MTTKVSRHEFDESVNTPAFYVVVIRNEDGGCICVGPYDTYSLAEGFAKRASEDNDEWFISPVHTYPGDMK